MPDKEQKNEKVLIGLDTIVKQLKKKQPYKAKKATFLLQQLFNNRQSDLGAVSSSNKKIQEIQQNLIPVEKVLIQLMRNMGEVEATEVMKAFVTMSHEVNEKLETFINLAIEKNMIDQKSKEKFQKRNASKEVK